MAHEEQQPDDLKPFEYELRELVPRGPKVDLARFMYRAGQASVSPVPPAPPATLALPGAWLWPTSTGIMTLIALSLGAVLLLTRSPLLDNSAPREPHLVVAPQPTTAPLVAESRPHAGIALENSPAADVTQTLSGEANYVRDREVALSQGIDALPRNQASSGTSGTPESYASLNQKLRREVQRQTKPAGFWTDLWNH
ncbi:MAG TPA: hypothetical protein VL096_09810 [Pirellulaceae bacterium]|nr:hypothetical protein [Pirellulaceae bacterium]